MLHFDKVLVKDTEFHINEKVPFSPSDKENKIVVEPLVQKGIDNTKKGRAIIKASINDDKFIENGFPFYIKLEIVGAFTCDEDADVVDKYAMNMVNILLPYVRTYVSSLTGLAGYQSIIIQPINILELMEKKDSTGSSKTPVNNPAKD